GSVLVRPALSEPLSGELTQHAVVEVHGDVAVEEWIDPVLFAPATEAAAKLQGRSECLDVVRVGEREVGRLFKRVDETAIGAFADPKDFSLGIVDRRDLPGLIEKDAEVHHVEQTCGSNTDDTDFLRHAGCLPDETTRVAGRDSGPEASSRNAPTRGPSRCCPRALVELRTDSIGGLRR